MKKTFLNIALAAGILLSYPGFSNTADTGPGKETTEVKPDPVKDNDKLTLSLIDDIMEVTGLSTNFEVYSADNDNAAAKIVDGKRYIIYDPKFIQKVIDQSGTNWAGISILAHEIGHHLNGHTLAKNKHNHQLELEADRFSGFILRKMGATLKEAQSGIYVLSSPRDGKTHPARNKRMVAIEQGWRKADEVIGNAEKKVKAKEFAFNIENEPKEENRVQLIGSVVFNNIPEGKFYLTKNLDLVEYDHYRLLKMGEVVTRGNSMYLQIGEDGIYQIEDDGTIINSRNRTVGYLTKVK